MINKTIIEGRISTDLELKKTSSNISCCNFYVAVEKFHKSKDKTTNYIKCVAWGKTAENLCTYCEKGKFVSIVGELETQCVENDFGKKYYMQISCTEIHFLPTPKKKSDEQKLEERNWKKEFETAETNFNISEEDIQF